jgi:multidrug efflux system membrane fusion protein
MKGGCIPKTLVVLIGASLFSCRAPEVVEREPVVRPVKTMVVGSEAQARLSFPGTVQAADRAELSFRVAGPLIELRVDEGDDVRRGQLLARIDPRDFEIALAQARASYEQAEADYARYKNLYERNAVPLAQFEFRRAARDVAAASYDQAQANLRDTSLVAPFDGHVGRKLVENFEDVVARQPILTLQGLNVVEIVIDVPESVMATFRAPNPRFTARFSSAPGSEFELRLKEAAAEADVQTQTFQVTFSMPQPDELRVLPGMTAEVAVDATAGGEAPIEGEPLIIPAEAVFASPGGQPRVWVVDRSTLTVQPRDVRVGAVTGESSIRVLEGLRPGETIAVAAVHQLQEGSKIRLMESRN